MDPIELELQKKYGNPQINVDPIEAQLASKYKQSAVYQKEPDFIDKVGEFGSQAGKSIIRTAQTFSGIGEKILQAPLKLLGADFNKKTSAETLLPKGLVSKPETSSQKAGEVFGQAIQYLTPVGAEKTVVKGTTLLNQLLTKLPKLAPYTKLGVKSLVGGTELAGKTALMGEDKKDVKSAGAVGLATPPTLKAAGSVGKFIFGDVFPAILGSATGIDPKTIIAAFKNPVEVAKYMSQKVIPLDVRNKAIVALEKYQNKVGDTFQKGLDSMAKLSPRLKPARTAAGEGYPGVFSGVKGEFKNVMNSGTENLKGTLNKFRISIRDNKLNFDKLNSSIISPTERKQIQSVWDTINNQKDFSVRGVQDVASRIGALAKFTDGAATRSSAVISKMLNVYKKGIKQVYPDLRALRSQYEVDKKIIKGLQDILKSNKNDVTNPTTATSVSKKLTTLFNEDNEAYVRALQRLEAETGDDLINQFLAANFDKMVPGSMGSKIAQMGLLAGGAAVNPLLFAVAPLFSPRFVGKLLTTTGKASQVANKLRPLLPNILK